jgi:hypothetical protein
MHCSAKRLAKVLPIFKDVNLFVCLQFLRDFVIAICCFQLHDPHQLLAIGSCYEKRRAMKRPSPMGPPRFSGHLALQVGAITNPRINKYHVKTLL